MEIVIGKGRRRHQSCLFRLAILLSQAVADGTSGAFQPSWFRIKLGGKETIVSWPCPVVAPSQPLHKTETFRLCMLHLLSVAVAIWTSPDGDHVLMAMSYDHIQPFSNIPFMIPPVLGGLATYSGPFVSSPRQVKWLEPFCAWTSILYALNRPRDRWTPRVYIRAKAESSVLVDTSVRQNSCTLLIMAFSILPFYHLLITACKILALDHVVFPRPSDQITFLACKLSLWWPYICMK